MNRPSYRHARHRGVALLIVLIVVTMLALTAYTFSSLMVAEKEAAVLAGRQVQAKMLVDSGVDQIRLYLEMTEDQRISAGGSFNNPSLFQAIPVVDLGAPTTRGRFGVIAPLMDDTGSFGGSRFGLEDESARLNLNALSLEEEGEPGAEEEEAAEDTASEDSEAAAGGAPGGAAPGNAGGGGAAAGGDATEEEGVSAADLIEAASDADTSGRAMLMGLPGMTEDIADAILDWLDEDDTMREYGAEYDYYASLDPPYAPKNGTLETIEELLLVRGVTPDLLFGRDVNRNGMIDIYEMDIPLNTALETADGSLDRGWSALLTLYSAEKNVDQNGIPRIDLNQEDLKTLYEELVTVFDKSWATFIIAYRQNGADTSDQEGQPASDLELDFSRPARIPIIQVLDLIGIKVRARLADNAGSVLIESPFADEPLAMGAYLPTLMDAVTASGEPLIPGRVNINQAPRSVLMAIPGMTDEIANQIVNVRDVTGEQVNDRNFSHETWLLSRAIVTLDEMRLFMPYMTAGGDVYRAQVVGYFDKGNISARAEVVVDATSVYPRVVFWRDISHLGRGFAPETLGVDLSDVTQTQVAR
ncbi:MAG: general secretion pathway protein GspK [Planctomycetales bacterium]|nr:general secretion pathway protein GspK [Planctomycetales bacterium]